MKLEITYDDLKKLIEEETRVKKKETIAVSKKELLEGLVENENEVLQKFNQSIQLWKKGMKIYRRFLQEAPGSKQMKSPGEMLSLPESFHELKNWHRLIKAFVGEELEMELGVLREIFRISTQAVTQARATRDSYFMASAGTTSPHLKIDGSVM